MRRFTDVMTGIALLTILTSSYAAFPKDISDYSGAELYQRFCAACHGDKGYGNGPVAASLKIVVPDLTRIAKRQGGAFPTDQIARIIDGRKVLPPHGSRDMPVWGFEFYTENEKNTDPAQRTVSMIERLTEYIRSLQRD